MSENNLFPDSEPKPTSLFEMNLDAQNSYTLRSSASWAKVLGVVGIMAGTVLIIMMAIALSRVESVSRYNYRYDRDLMDEIFYGKIGLWITIVSGAIFIIGGVLSFNYGNKINAALKSNDQDGLNAGFAALRNYFALRSITVIIVLIFLLLLLSRTV